tara:strand:+ start:429 stop:1532 length:1104 start_codon:yes stop_codon:yes gene_type:complete
MIKYIIILLILLFIVGRTITHEQFSQNELNLRDNYYKKKYIYTNNNIGYLVDNNKDTIKKIVVNFSKNLIKKTKILFTKIIPYNDVLTLMDELVNTFTNINFIICDDVTINNLFFEFFNKSKYNKFRFVSTLNRKIIFPICNLTNERVAKNIIREIGMEDSKRNRYIGKDVKNFYKLKNININLHFYKKRNDSLDALTNNHIDLYLYIDSFPNDTLHKIFVKNKNFTLNNNSFQTIFKNDAYSYYKKINFDLNKIVDYLPRKTTTTFYTTFKPDIELYSFNISLYTGIDTDFKTIYNIKKYLSNHKENNDIYNNNYSNFSLYFLNHPAVNKYLEEENYISSYKNKECINVTGKCTPDMLHVTRLQYL